ncbi:MAG: succinate dehydrogenase cytochrome b subunit [Bacteroidia bacterium]|nr:succinate dehydrogenase cytochrome b subunit [Bacteroidia bacterium]
MGNILTSSIGKKLIMSISGLFLILFLLIHLLANSAYLLGAEAFDAVIEFMGSPLVVIMVPVLAAGFIVHIAYAVYLTLYNRKARGSERYAVNNQAQTDSWASKNMFVLGIIILGVLVFHLSHFWAKMQLPEFTGGHAQNGNDLMVQTFGNVWILVCYLVWFVALWFHLTHGFWSAFQTIGANNTKWLSRLKVVSYIYSTFIALGFSVIAIYAYITSLG